MPDYHTKRREISSRGVRAMGPASLFTTQDPERFLSAQADHFTGSEMERKESVCSVRNDGVGRLNAPRSDGQEKA